MRAATRGSALARWQTSFVLDALGALDGPGGGSAVVVETTGDRRSDVPIHEIGGQGVFVKEVQAAVLDGRADIAVHSAKDLPSGSDSGLVIGAFPARGNPFDCLVGSTLAALPAGARVATGSVRRRAQLAWLRPDLTFADLRGNIDTRLAKAAGFDAVVMAAAALERLGYEDRMAEVLGPDVMLPQVAQGALAVECRADDADTLAALAAIDDADTRRAVEAERSFLAELGGGCDLPVGAYAVATGGGEVSITGLVASLDGRSVLRETRSGADGVALGAEVARHLLALTPDWTT
ncbi:MAG TPA: hydroxymethylbilane synthase [Acidimicrobiales bacterium]|jgi:hydroxymethylbilane synthase|nr:hydroxymethylbilane synthase [Acidimicrobiales bacterium]